MLFLAVFCGFLAENQREHMIEHRREKQYMRSLLSDLAADTATINKAVPSKHLRIAAIDSVFMFFSNNPEVKTIKGKLFKAFRRTNYAEVAGIRAGREVDYGWFFLGGKRRENYDDWWRCEVRFDPVLDELFGITHSKQAIAKFEREVLLGKDLPYSSEDVYQLVKVEGLLFDIYYFHETELANQLRLNKSPALPANVAPDAAPSGSAPGDNIPVDASSSESDVTTASSAQKRAITAGDLKPIFLWHRIDDDALLDAMALLLVHGKVLVEPSGAAALAVALRGDLPGSPRRIGVIFQDFVRWQLSARDNIALGDHRRSADDEAVVAAARAQELGADAVNVAMPRLFPLPERDLFRYFEEILKVVHVPLVIRMATGAGRQLAAQHSHSLEGWYAHIPGLRILTPATLEDALRLLRLPRRIGVDPDSGEVRSAVRSCFRHFLRVPFQLVRLENEIDELYARGGEPVGISVDSAGRNAAMVRHWHLSFPVESDPGGGQDHVGKRPPRRRTGGEHLEDPRDAGRYGVHQERRRIGRLAARNVNTDAVERGDLLAELDTVRLRITPRLDALLFMVRLHPFHGLGQCVAPRCRQFR